MGSQITNLLAGLSSIKDDEPKEGRKVITFPVLKFVTGLEIFAWNSKALGNQPLTSIQSMWLDASNVISGVAGAQALLINIGQPLAQSSSQGGRQIVISIPGNAATPSPNIGQDARQGFFLLPSTLPFTMQVSVTLNASGPVNLALYNFNVFNLGEKYSDIVKALRDVLSSKSHISAGVKQS